MKTLSPETFGLSINYKRIVRATQPKFPGETLSEILTKQTWHAWHVQDFARQPPYANLIKIKFGLGKNCGNFDPCRAISPFHEPIDIHIYTYTHTYTHNTSHCQLSVSSVKLCATAASACFIMSELVRSDRVISRILGWSGSEASEAAALAYDYGWWGRGKSVCEVLDPRDLSSSQILR